jgi:hypothetical protein
MCIYNNDDIASYHASMSVQWKYNLSIFSCVPYFLESLEYAVMESFKESTSGARAAADQNQCHKDHIRF